jgi:hypothetical protein
MGTGGCIPREAGVIFCRLGLESNAETMKGETSAGNRESGIGCTASHVRHSRSMIDEAGSQKSNDVFGRKIVPGEEIKVSANDSLVVGT